MTHNTKPVSPLRQRMLEDMTLRKLSTKTQSQLYPGRGDASPAFWAARPTRPTAEDLRRYQLHLVDTGTSRILLNAYHHAPCASSLA